MSFCRLYGHVVACKAIRFFEVCGHQRSDTGVGDTRLPHIYTQERNFFFPICFACRMAARYVGTISQRDYCLIIGEGFCRTCLFTGSGRKSAVFDNDGKCSRLNVALGGIELFPLIRSLEQFCQGIVEISIEGIILRLFTSPLSSMRYNAVLLSIQPTILRRRLSLQLRVRSSFIISWVGVSQSL